MCTRSSVLFVCVCVSVRAYVYLCVYECVCAYVYMCVYECVCVCVRMYICVFMSVCVYECVCACVCEVGVSCQSCNPGPYIQSDKEYILREFALDWMTWLRVRQICTHTLQVVASVGL